jgi:hypothetical protein
MMKRLFLYLSVAIVVSIWIMSHLNLWNEQRLLIFINGWEAVALFLTAYLSYFILKKQSELTNEPFITSSPLIKLRPNTFSPPSIILTNIGDGPALFVRVSFTEKDPDKPENALLEYNEPHSVDLGKNKSSEEILFDENKFYNYILGISDNGNLTSVGNSQGGQELQKLLKNKENNDIYLYFHLKNILQNQIIFRAKYRLIMHVYNSGTFLQFDLKRMEVEPIRGMPLI